jgi:hypothetical protein
LQYLWAEALTLPELYLTILKETYKDAWQVLVALAVDSSVMTVSCLFSFVLFRLERIDEMLLNKLLEY